ncbi:hypothetical protein [Pseudomonas gingeri]|uniref:hypothetical protein n=1 Tax=Pseudomonas gingeri TaxID=117681 RepID=UPI00210EA44E|nr:hypothetical protein [Pseudomonas gingeri]
MLVEVFSEVLAREKKKPLEEKSPSIRTAVRFMSFSPGKKKPRTAGQVLTIACALYWAVDQILFRLDEAVKPKSSVGCFKTFVRPSY